MTFSYRKRGRVAALTCLLSLGLFASGCARTAPSADESGDSAEENHQESAQVTLREEAKSPFRFVADSDDAPTGPWGTLRGKLVYAGKAPAPEKIVVNKDIDFCGKHNLVDESLVVGKEGGIANMGVYISLRRGQKVKVHESYADATKKPVVLDNNSCRFEPHVFGLLTGQKLIIKNSDTVGHNTNIGIPRSDMEFNETVPAGGEITKVSKVAQRFPFPAKCNVHPWMTSYLLIRDDPYMTFTKEDGVFEIKNIPAGEHAFAFWHELPGFVSDLEVGSEKTDRRGTVKIKIPAGAVLDLGEIKVAPSQLKSRF